MIAGWRAANEPIRTVTKRNNKKAKTTTSVVSAPPMTLDELLGGRQNLATHAVFVQHFVKAVVGNQAWNMEILRPNSNSRKRELGSVSDEAYARLQLRSNWDRWADLYRLRCENPNIKNVTTDVQPLLSYVVKAGEPLDKDRVECTATIVEEFNKEFLKVRQDRNDYPQADEEIANMLRQNMKGRNSKPSANATTSIPLCYGSLHQASTMEPVKNDEEDDDDTFHTQHN